MKLAAAVERCYAIADRNDCELDYMEIIAKVSLETGLDPMAIHDAWAQAEDGNNRSADTATYNKVPENVLLN